jgi:hypothetical protein
MPLFSLADGSGGCIKMLILDLNQTPHCTLAHSIVTLTSDKHSRAPHLFCDLRVVVVIAILRELVGKDGLCRSPSVFP